MTRVSGVIKVTHAGGQDTIYPQSASYKELVQEANYYAEMFEEMDKDPMVVLKIQKVIR